jgi:hypothetical protein
MRGVASSDKVVCVEVLEARRLVRVVVRVGIVEA